MLNKNERMEKLNNAGVNTGKYFNIDLPEGLAPGATISVIINEYGQPVIMNGNGNYAVEMYKSEPNADAIANQIIADGYVRNTKLHRRFVMAQMFHMLGYKSWRGNEEGYTAALKNCYSYDYTFDMMLEEVKVLSKLEARDNESFLERSHFFTKRVIIATMEDYVEKLKEHIEASPTYKCKGIPYKKIKGTNIFVVDLNKKVYAPLNSQISRIKYNQGMTYAATYRILQDFMKNMIRIPYNTTKCKEWVDAFKGEGAYYTLKNLVMFHNCGIKVDKFDVRFGIDAMVVLKSKLDEYKGEGWRMFALMKKVIEDNNFNFQKRMQEIYNK